MEPEHVDKKLADRQRRLDTLYRIIFFATIGTVALGVIALFVQSYNISTQINNQVTTIVDNQAKNRSITDSQNSLVLGYLICIGKIAPENRTDTTIQTCVKQAQSTDIKQLQGQ